MSQQSNNPAPNSENLPSLGFNTQSQMGLAEVLQMCCLSRRSGQITFRSGESYGHVYIQHGRVLHAMCGVVEGEEAIYLMLSWPGGGFSLNDDILPHKKTINLTWEQLLFEGARRTDIGLSGNSMAPAIPVTTPEPVTSSRVKDSEPKLTISPPDAEPFTYVLEQEYTHVGRLPDNAIQIAHPSVSSRHCIFILSGPDIVLRDLNSSNGTYVNRAPISETILRPGDFIQIGVVEVKFEAGIKRPKLSANPTPEPMIEVKKSSMPLLSSATVRLPDRLPDRSRKATVDDNAYVKGSAISYDNIAKPAVAGRSKPWAVIIIAILFILGVIAGGYYYFVILHGAL
jgi:pSer/pThr/pTyr-binding forkhead associated (FHA) protein